MNDFTIHRSMKKVGEILRAAREAKGMTVQDVYKFIKIHPKYLEALEENDYAIFSSPVHIKGFLKVYSAFLGLNVDDVLAFFRREYDEKVMNKARIIKPIENPKVLITPASVMVFATLVLIFGFFSYLFYQYKSFTGAPSLIIEKPVADSTVSETSIEIVGRTDRDSSLFLNGQKITISPDGAFSLKIDLTEGINGLNFLAVNKLGKETKEVRTVVLDKTLASVQGASTSKVLEIFTENSPAFISIVIDSSNTSDISMLANTSYTVQATQSIKLKTNNAGSIKVKFNDKDYGTFGGTSEVKEQEFR